MSEVSVVIPTFKRAEDLKELLYSILRQTKPPKEVIVVDDSDDCKTKDLIKHMDQAFSNKKIILKYRRGGGKGLAQARNIGAAQISGTIYCGLDDDVILDERYIEEILRVYETHPNALGVQGYLEGGGGLFGERNLGGIGQLILNSFFRIFFLFHKEKEGFRVLPSFRVTYPYSWESRVKECQWLSGTNSSYKRGVVKDFKWDENLKGYSLCEDLDFSFRVQRRYPNSLHMTQDAIAFHKRSSVGRRKTKHLILMSTTYRTYFFYKNIEQTLLNKIIFVWSMLGQFVTTFFFWYKKESRSTVLTSLITSYVRTLKHLNEIKRGKFPASVLH